MEEEIFKQQMRAFNRWKEELIHVIKDFQHWLQDNYRTAPEIDLRLFDVIESLQSDRLIIAFVAEFSRGKTELINSIFFSDYKRRLLPSDAGRTTMCPTELFYDHGEEAAYIRLLPIETRMQESCISELKRDISQWKTIALDINSPDQMVEALREVVRVKVVPVADAIKLGLYDESYRRSENDPIPKEVEIPLWRHALISFPHPLLQQGLTILDTPGLNALGSEPELTINMLPNAHAVLFVLAADTGVTRSDLDVWEFHIKKYRGNGQQGLAAALNKIDTLWDEMKSEEAIEASIANQCRETAAALDLPLDRVFPLSAQKALLAKSRQDEQLLAKSRIGEVEKFLANDIIGAKQEIVRNNVVAEVGNLIVNIRGEFNNRLFQLTEQLNELQGASGKSGDIVKFMLNKAKDKQTLYNKNLEYFQSSQRALNQQGKLMLSELDLANFDKLVDKTRKQMTDSWTTIGLKTGMKTFFDGLRETIDVVSRHVDQTYTLVASIYKKFHEENGLPAIEAPRLSMTKYRNELKRLNVQAEEFRNSPVTTMTEQGAVIKKFVITMVSHAREIYVQSGREAEAWLTNILTPLAKQVSQQKQLLEEHSQTLEKVKDTRESLAAQVQQLQESRAKVSKQLATLEKMYSSLRSPAPPASGEASPPP